MSQPQSLPPMPPTVGRKHVLLRMLAGRKKGYLSNLMATSYRMKMGYLRLPGRNLYMPNLPELARQILVTDAWHFPKSDLNSNMLRMLLGNGLFVANGEEWKRQRRLIDPAFALTRLARVFPLMRDACDDLLSRLAKIPEGDEVLIDEEMTHVTADVICRTMFSTPLTQSAASKLYAAFSRFQDVALVIGMLEATWLPNFILSGRRRKAAKAAKEIRALIIPLVEARLAKLRRGEELEEDILSYLITSVDPKTGASFSHDELVDQTAFLFLAGHETSASSFGWTLYLLAMRQDVQDRVYDETADIVGDRPVEFGDIRKLSYTRCVFKEALRLYPPVGFLPREATRHECMRDKKIKPRDIMLVSPWLLHRHRLVWPDPDAFDPDRFAGKECKEAIRTAYMPFSMGPRVCTGAGFAQQEAILLLASIVRKYRLEPVEGHVPTPVGHLTVRSENGIKLRLRSREPIGPDA